MNFKKAFNITLKEFEYHRSKINLRGLPSVYQVELTNSCPMSCVMCVRQKMTRPIGFIDEELFKDVVNQAEGVNTHIILHHFGESLLHPKLEALLSYLKNTKIKSVMSANPTELTAERIEAVCRGGLNRLILSVDGATESTYQSVRGAHADLTLAKNNINNLLDYKNKYKLKHPEIEIQMIMMKKTGSEIEKFKGDWQKPGINRVLIKEFYLWSLGTDAMKELSSGKRGRNNFLCNFPWSSLVVMWDGRVVPCCNDYDGLYVLGDLKKKALSKIWNDAPMLELRAQHLENRLRENKLCCNCTERPGNPRRRLYPFCLDSWFLNRIKAKIAGGKVKDG